MDGQTETVCPGHNDSAEQYFLNDVKQREDLEQHIMTVYNS